MNHKASLLLLLFLFVPTVEFSSACADIVVYNKNLNSGLAGFNTAAGSPPVSINFDSIATGTNVTNSTIAGVTLRSSTDGAPLIVVDGNSTFTPSGFSNVTDPSTNKLFPTSGSNVLSPGGLELGPGPDKPIENDDLELVFQFPTTAFGFDLLTQSADGKSFTNIQVFNQLNNSIYSGNVPITNNGTEGPGGADFWGATTSDGDLISRIVIDESDDTADFPDSNVGYDTFRFVAIPEPTAFGVLTGLVLLSLASHRRRLTRC